MSDRESLRLRLCAGLAALHLRLDDTAIARLLDYVELLQRWNATYNLTAVRDPEEMVTRHLLDSLAIAPYVSGKTLADLGTGAGLPGIPLAIAAPERRVLLIDSNGKKARFLREAVRVLQLPNVRIEARRVEDVRAEFDTVTARAFAALGDMLRLAGHLLAPDGRLVALKGLVHRDEILAVGDGYEVREVLPLRVPGLAAARHAVIIQRTQAAVHGHAA
jgi:16S rRNA (guanine527-N7)-methyltransferase